MSALIGALLAPLAGGSVAHADQPVPRDQILSSVGVDTDSADYVVLIDTSGSMQSDGLYGQVEAALTPFLGAMAPTDHLSVITFDTVPALRFSGPVATTATRAIGQLPKTATGLKTDLGAAIGAGLDELERPGATSVGAFILMTDGLHDPPPGSAYPTTNGPAWDALAARGRTLVARHDIGAYAVALRADTNAALLKQTFPNAETVALPPDQIADYLQRVKDKVRIQKARRLLSGDVGKGATITWPAAAVQPLDLSNATAHVTMEVHATTKHAPITVTNLAVTAMGLPLTASVRSAPLVLSPGATATVSVDFSLIKGAPVKRLVGRLLVSAAVASPWDQTLEQDFALSLRPALAGPQASVLLVGIHLAKPPGALQRVVGLLLALVVVLLLLILAVLVDLVLRRGKPPTLRVSMAIRRWAARNRPTNPDGVRVPRRRRTVVLAEAHRPPRCRRMRLRRGAAYPVDADAVNNGRHRRRRGQPGRRSVNDASPRRFRAIGGQPKSQALPRLPGTYRYEAKPQTQEAGSLMVELHYERGPQIAGEDLLAEVSRALPQTVLLGDTPDPLTLVHNGYRATPGNDEGMPMMSVVLRSGGEYGRNKRRIDLTQTSSFPEARNTLARCHASVSVVEVLGEAFSPADRLQAFRTTVLAVCGLHRPLMAWWPRAIQASPPPSAGGPALMGLVNVRLIAEDSGGMVLDTLGLHVFGLPDLQCHCHGLDAARLAAHLTDLAAHVFEHGDVLRDGSAVDGLAPGERWLCHHDLALVAPERTVVDLHPGPGHAAGKRHAKRGSRVAGVGATRG